MKYWRRKPPKPLRGTPAWTVTFGDLMTLLLTFFVLLFSVSEVKQNKVYELIHSIRTHWKVEAPTAGFHTVRFDSAVNALAEEAREAPDQHLGKAGKTSQQVENPFGPHAHVAQHESSLHLNIEGLVIFDAGSAVVKSQGREILARVRRHLSGAPNRIFIVGHTSPERIEGGRFGDHDDLAIQRAKAVKAILMSNEENDGVREERIRICSDGRNSKLPGVDWFDAEERARLRRVEIIVTPENAINRRK